MAEQKTQWQTMRDHARERGCLGLPLYVVFSTPAGGMDAVRENLENHLAYQKEIEARGIMFAAGPLADDAEENGSGEGLIIIRAASVEEARKIAAADPMHQSGARTFRVRPWLLNEGSLTLKVSYSDGGGEIS